MDTIPPDPQESSQDLLRHFIEEISGELQLEPLLTRIVEYACRLIGADDGTIGLYNWHRGVIRTAAVYRMPEGELGAEMGPGVGLAGHVLQTGEPLQARYGDIARITLPELADNQVIGMPIHRKGELTGFFGIGVAPPKQLPEGALQTLELFARHAGIAIENARRYERARRRTARFELVARVAQIINAGSDLKLMLQQTADAIHDVLEFPNVDIPLLDPDDPEVLVVEIRGGGYKQQIQGVDRLPISVGVMGAAIRQRRAQRVDNARVDDRYITPPSTQGSRAELAVPILVAGQAVGVVNVEGEQPYDELDQLTIEIIADHLGIAIQNAGLHEQNREAAVWQERMRLRRELHDSVTQILSSISLLAQALPSAWRSSPEEGERRAQRLAELAQTAFAEMRALLRELQPPNQNSSHISRRSRSFLGLERLRDGGLGAALPRLLEAMIPESLGRRYRFDLYVPQHLPHEEALYRVCQEAVSNVIRHSGAQQVNVEAHVDQTHVWLLVRDDGGGLPADAQGGIGLKSMRERLARLGGDLALRAAQPSGLEVLARLPRRDRRLESP
ncbi:GAF domain-containing sensor histidine kinase [Pseudomarimonas arenosa]|uniref:GAF domain-containing sensor histidine kinase n=1 Tax=Pseudomarimonas arenosa TaxID=2774145 RepID=A0AAW3ZK59_9GAMM|nr:GAF domain-containing sensor histidine kinase [Pseudomarimonas arenosa]MBD8525422.1 GAF domain-containing sensor histidine kinase [Pseudomarimonas arenosa]